MSVDRGNVDDSDVKSSFATLADGTRVWNRWSEVKDRRFRLEVAERADGAVEYRKAKSGPPLAAMGGVRYRLQTFTLGHGDGVCSTQTALRRQRTVPRSCTGKSGLCGRCRGFSGRMMQVFS